MLSKAHFRSPIFGRRWSTSNAEPVLNLKLLFLILLLLSAVQPAVGQTFQVIYNFTGAADGATPYSGLTMDAAGNLYGTTYTGENIGTCGVTQLTGCGTVFKLSKRGANWSLRVLHRFLGGSDGANPWARVVFGPDGALYGTTSGGGVTQGCPSPGCGTVFRLAPAPTVPPNTLNAWVETVAHRFASSDGANPGIGDLLFDAAGNVYGTTTWGGTGSGGGGGTVYELTPSGGGWTESVLNSFDYGGPHGWYPAGGLVFDQFGNLYGTTFYGGDMQCGFGNGCGTVFQLARSQSGWTENVLYSFQTDEGGTGAYPAAGVIFDRAGDLYGSASWGGAYLSGTVFTMSPPWQYFGLLTNFSGNNGNSYPGPFASLLMDASDNFYGTTRADGLNNQGSVFKLTSSGSYISLHDFTGASDGGGPWSNVIMDAVGNLYGTASSGGAYGYGVVWEITP